MKILKHLLLVFFSFLGFHQVVQDVWSWIDPEFRALREPGYFSATAFLLVYATVWYLKQKDAAQAKETN